uniref:FCP1 homology domain-containing protein n=1 Tax=Helicotheca tamesis TaxID=374047 RepID=A0A7S2I2G2_9STRA|mmetsp:Transcript_4870/g.6674  ORF Transcript_4870/g.6674 Transcript_4870/m.6674 type:complete len:188 (+) Transcript_4870:90-653(+)
MASFQVSDEALSNQCEEAISRLQELKINFLAIDFDKTIVDVHTHGQWKGSAHELSTHVRPLFQHLISAAIGADIKVAVVTFSPQCGQIKDVLEIALPESSNSIVVRGRDRTWSYVGAGSKDGKQSHMASAVEEIESMHEKLDISKNTTLLIDDDVNNIKVALLDGVRAVWLNPNKSHNLLKDIQALV